MNRAVLSAAICAALGLSVMATASYAATVNTGDQLTLTAGKTTTVSSIVTSVTGSYFAMDANADNMIEQTEKLAISQGTTGLVIGTTTAAGASHLGAPVAGDTNAIDAPWAFLGNTGSDYLRSPVSGSTTAGLDFSGWTFTWNGIPVINVGGGAWQPLNCSALGCSGHTFTNGNAEFTWDGVYGDAYTLNYAATVPAGDPSGLGNFQYFLHLEGVVNKAPATVPLPAAMWLLGSGLIGLVGVGRRKRSNQA